MKKAKGFTLLEMCVCIVVFSIFLEALWGFYSHIQMNNIVFNQQTKLSSEADNVEAFIKESIRDAEQIKIIAIKESQNENEAVNVNEEIVESGHTNDIQGMELVRIEFTKTEGSETRECTLIIENNADEVTKGKKSLVYKVVGGTDKIISDQIENIKVTSDAASNLVTFDCTLHKKDETADRLKCTKVFSESVAYKGHI